jgi:hypothetical protein
VNVCATILAFANYPVDQGVALFLAPTRASTGTFRAQADTIYSNSLQNHSPNEAEYIESCTEAKLLATIADGKLAQYRMSYHLPPPTTDREFIILILTKDVTPPEGPRKMQVVTVPTEHPDAQPRKGFVRGKYASVEEVEELEGGGVEWR